MVDGMVAAVVCGPVSLHPHAWINPMLAIAPEAWDTGGTPGFAAIKAVGDRHNAISDCLVDGRIYAPVYRPKSNGEVDPTDWCEGFMQCVNLNRRKWKDVLDADNVHHALMLPILLYCKHKRGRPVLGPVPPGPEGEQLLKVSPTHIPLVVAAMRKHFQLQRFGTPHPDTLVGGGLGRT
jgi:yecA family protein